MSSNLERARLLLRWDEGFLLGGVMLSVRATLLIQDADTAFVAGAYLAALLASQAAMEAHLTYEYAEPPDAPTGFLKLIDNSPLPDSTKVYKGAFARDPSLQESMGPCEGLRCGLRAHRETRTALGGVGGRSHSCPATSARGDLYGAVGLE